MSGQERSTADGRNRGERLPEDVVADLLESDRRRRLLACLADADGALPVSDLARCVAERESAGNDETIDQTTISTVRDDVYHEHLPKLTATGVVTFDSLVGTVEFATKDERLRAHVGE
jgi:hypothetical protein